MIDVQQYILRTMKKEIFGGDEAQNKAARQVLAELKTKQKDVVGEITAEVQYKILSKMMKERGDSIVIYTNNNRWK